MQSRILKAACVALAGAGTLLPMSLAAQIATATVRGTVSDSSGAVVPKATITATETATGVKTTAISSGDGQYNLPFLKPGTYNLTVTMPGFKDYEQKNLTLASGDVPTINIPLAVGDSQQTITVEATPPLLGTADASLGQAVPPYLALLEQKTRALDQAAPLRAATHVQSVAYRFP